MFTTFPRPGILTAMVLLSAIIPLRAQDDLKVISGSQGNNRWLKYTDAENGLYHHLASEAFKLLDDRKGKVARLNSRQDWIERQRLMKQALQEAIGPFPEKTPLNARIVRTLDKGDYRVEHLIFESQPGFYVTASVFVPRGIRERAPAVIYCSGHSAEAYRSTAYQQVIINLAKKGFIVLAFDPVGQGERLEYFDPEEGRSVLGGGTREHSYSGAQAFIAGSSQAMHMIWDGIRSVDYLFSRSDVDPRRIGITGRSGGGTQSAYIAAMDDRIHAAAPENYITSFRRLLESIGPQDAEQNLCQGIARGIDHADFLEVRAPKPTLMLTTTRDFFSIQGASETAAEVQRAFAAFGKPENFQMVSDDAVHMSTRRNREALYAFFQKHLDLPGDAEDLEVEFIPPEELRVTETGQLRTSLEGETVYSLNRKLVARLLDDLQASRNGLRVSSSELKSRVSQLAGIRKPRQGESPVFTGRLARPGYAIEKYFVQGEGNYPIPYLLMVPEQPNGQAVLYLHPTDKGGQAGAGQEMEWFVKRGFLVLAPDLVGIGEMGPGAVRGDGYIGGTSFNLWFASILIGRSIAGVRAGDVLRLIDVLQARAEPPGQIYGVAREGICPVLLHAALFSPAITRIALMGPYTSYRSIAEGHRYNPAFIHNVVPGALTAYDLPDIAAALAPRRLLLVNVTDEDGNPAREDMISEDLGVVIKAYEAAAAPSQLNIKTWQSYETLDKLFLPLVD
jgi:hypothetical protein